MDRNCRGGDHRPLPSRSGGSPSLSELSSGLLPGQASVRGRSGMRRSEARKPFGGSSCSSTLRRFRPSGARCPKHLSEGGRAEASVRQRSALRSFGGSELLATVAHRHLSCALRCASVLEASELLARGGHPSVIRGFWQIEGSFGPSVIRGGLVRGFGGAMGAGMALVRERKEAPCPPARRPVVQGAPRWEGVVPGPTRRAASGPCSGPVAW